MNPTVRAGFTGFGVGANAATPDELPSRAASIQLSRRPGQTAGRIGTRGVVASRPLSAAWAAHGDWSPFMGSSRRRTSGHTRGSGCGRAEHLPSVMCASGAGTRESQPVPVYVAGSACAPRHAVRRKPPWVLHGTGGERSRHAARQSLKVAGRASIRMTRRSSVVTRQTRVF